MKREREQCRSIFLKMDIFQKLMRTFFKSLYQMTDAKAITHLKQDKCEDNQNECSTMCCSPLCLCPFLSLDAFREVYGAITGILQYDRPFLEWNFPTSLLGLTLPLKTSAKSKRSRVEVHRHHCEPDGPTFLVMFNLSHRLHSHPLNCG